MDDLIRVNFYDDYYLTIRQWLYDQPPNPMESIGDVARKHNVSWTTNEYGVTYFKIPSELLTLIILSKPRVG